MNKASFKLVFAGPAVDNGEIDIQELASSFMAMAGVIQATNSQINGERAKISVKLKATDKGSVIVDLVIVQSLIEQAATLLDALAGHKDGISAANEIADLLFKVGSVGVVTTGGFFSFMKWLRGRRPDKVEVSGTEAHIYIGNAYFVADKKIIGLAEDLQVREQSKKLISILNRDGIQKLSAIMQDDKPLEIEKADVSSFDIQEPEKEDIIIEDKELEMHLQIDSLSFKEGNKWRMTDGAEPFYVILDDIDFLNKVTNDEISFSKNDVLHCLVKERQVQTVKGLLKKERTIIRVIEHKHASRQLKLL